ncbi:hypothetical protein JD844_017837 [Phrynosoma platyrhinos]|uniref:RRM domain-containing protein n=1 Tax=Phrynosoma platyrhinos TaxID=52577 RepID=A0ABQ7SME2_PHRPL|nr:hypothetical protein JD844_017837 [Phrynosoma platyrhinos]
MLNCVSSKDETLIDKHASCCLFCCLSAFVTLLNGEQAQNAIRLFHQHSLRGKEISVQLQPTDALLCITNLPTSYTLQEFEELVRPYGNVERHFLIYSEVTGYSKGYGFVEYMKKDSAAKARLDLIGKQLGENVLFAQWMDVNQLTPKLIHSKCLCVENLPADYTDPNDLVQAFSAKHKPVFFQLAQEEDSSVGGFGVIEYETAEQAEEVQQSTDGLTIKEKSIHVSYCAPGAPGRSTLATLIAAQRMVRERLCLWGQGDEHILVVTCNQAHLMMKNNRKGLLPEPNAVQIMKSLNTPAMLQMLLQPQLHGCLNKFGKLLKYEHCNVARCILGRFLINMYFIMFYKTVVGAPMTSPHVVTPFSPALLHLNKVHQSKKIIAIEGLWNNLLRTLFNNLQHFYVSLQKPSLLGEPPAVLLQTMLGMGTVPQVTTDMGSHGEARNCKWHFVSYYSQRNAP